MKDKERIKGIIEAILFTMGESVAISRLSEVLDIEEDTLKELLEEMKGDYAGKDRGICLIELDGAYQICTKIETYEYVKKLVSQPKKRSLTDVMLETLSIVAYKQPVTKQEIEAIRGVKSDFAVNKLLEYRLIKELGRLDTIGRQKNFYAALAYPLLRNFRILMKYKNRTLWKKQWRRLRLP